MIAKPNDGATRGFFCLLDDLYILDRWHLGDVYRNGVDQKVALDAHRPIDDGLLDVEITHPGHAIEYCHTCFTVPVATARLAAEIARIAGPDVQRLPARILGHAGYEVLNCTRVVSCVDEALTGSFVKWTSTDHRSDLAGNYRSVTDLVVAVDQVPIDAHFFRVAGWVALIVSAELKVAMEAASCPGARFVDVSPRQAGD